MNKLTKKITISIVILATAVMMVPSMAKAVTIADLQAQIDALLLQLAALQGSTGTAPTACTGITSFATNMTLGSTGADVKCLQALLNASADTQVAASGVGSKGNETSTFGPLTKAAVMKYQTKNSISPAAGYVGPITRAKLTTALGGGTPGVDVCSNIDGIQTTVPTGKVKDTSGNCVDAGTGGITTPGVEGSIVATMESTPTSVTINTKSTDKGVSAVKVKASGSDVIVSRVDLNFNKRPWLYVKNIIITDGTTSKTIAVSESGSTEITVGSSYDVRIEGVNILIPKDTEKVLTVKVDAVSALPGTETSTSVNVTLNANAIRAIDGKDIQQYAPSAALAARTFTVKTGDTASVAISAHTNNPKARPIIVQSTTETTDVVLAVLNAKATGNDAILRTLEFKDPTASGTLDVVTLYDGSTKLASTSSIETASSTLSNINLLIPKDTTKVLTLKGTVKKAQGNYESTGSSTIDAGAASSSVTVGAEATSFAAEDATSFATATITGSDVSSQAAYFYTKAPTLTLVEGKITGLTAPSGSLTPQQAEARIRVNIKANGSDIYIGQAAGNQNASNGIMVATSSISASTTFSGETISSNAEVAVASEMWVVRDGDTKWFEWTAIVTDATGASEGMGSTGKNVAPQITDLRWGITQAAAYGNGTMMQWPDTDFWTDYKTPTLFLQSPN